MSTSESTMAQPGVEAVSELPKRRESSEWFWRVVALMMVIAIGWIVWIAIQISPPPLVTNSAFEAAARARVADRAHGGLKSQGAAPLGGTGTSVTPSSAATPAAASTLMPAMTPKPPVDVDRLRLADSITTPLPAQQGVKPAAQ